MNTKSSVLVCSSFLLYNHTIFPTQLPRRFDVDVVVAAADADDDAQSFKFLQVLTGQSDGVIHHGTNRLVQHLREHVPLEPTWLTEHHAALELA